MNNPHPKLKERIRAAWAALRRWSTGLFAAAVFAAAVSPPLSAEEKAIPKFKKTEWKVGIAEFDVPEDSAALVVSRMIREELSGIVRRDLSPDERRALARSTAEDQEIVYLKSLAALHAERDGEIFKANFSRSAVNAVQVKINKLNETLAALRALSPEQIKIPEFLPVRISHHKTAGADLEAFRRKEKLDMLIGGEITRAGDYFGIGAYAFSENGRNILWEGAGGDDDFAAVAREIASSARGLILGRPWAGLIISTSPDNAVITIDDAPAGVGRWVDFNRSPGPITVMVSAEGYRTRIIEEVLAAGEITELEPGLELGDTRRILVSSQPSRASVRLGTLWLGRTPLLIDAPDRSVPVTIEKEGFRSRVLPLAPDTKRFTVPLEAVLVDPREDFTESRRRMYNAAAWFSFSVAPTMILLGISENYLNMLKSAATRQDQINASRSYKVSSGVMWGGIAVNAALLTVVLFRLARYLKASENLSK